MCKQKKKFLQQGKKKLQETYIFTEKTQFVFKVHESRYKQYGVTPHFSIEKNYVENLLKKILRKDKY